MSAQAKLAFLAKLSRMAFQVATVPARRAEFMSLASKYLERPQPSALFASASEIPDLGKGYTDDELNGYIIAKARRWLADLDPATARLQPHVCVLLWTIGLAAERLGRPVRVVDIGGGAPVIPVLLQRLQLGHRVASYTIVESEAFVRACPQEWDGLCTVRSRYEGEDCDLMILSSVLPYLSKDYAQELYRLIAATPPRFLYLGRTSFLREDYPVAEVYTVQESPFRNHGAQVDVGAGAIEAKIARYAKRHFKWSELSGLLSPLDYRMVFENEDSTGLELIGDLGLYAKNSLWERAA